MFDSSIGANEDGYEMAYTVDDSVECVADETTDSEDFIIFINEGIDAGEDNSGDVCRANVDRFIFKAITTIKKLLLKPVS